MATPEAVEAHYATQARQAEAAAIMAARQWRNMAVDLDASWARIVRRLVLFVSAAQLGAARSGAGYVPAALAEEGIEAAPVADVRPQAWTGVASDGRALDGLLYSAVVRTRLALGTGAAEREALAAGGKWLAQIVRTQVADAGRGAAGVAIAARPNVGYTRMVSPPCCQRCAVLAGKFFRWNEGFQRHPGCDCRHTPTGGSIDGFTSTIEPGQVRDLTQDQRKAIADGADLGQVINSHRAGRRSKDGMTTAEGGRRQRGARLTPEGIYRLSATREEAVQRLRDNGYLL